MKIENASHRPSIFQLIFGGGTPRHAAGTALVVGTVLMGINHGDTLASGELPQAYKVILTYCVPYLVTTWGAVTGKLSEFHEE